jgi:hypothetical protein
MILYFEKRRDRTIEYSQKKETRKRIINLNTPFGKEKICVTACGEQKKKKKNSM